MIITSVRIRCVWHVSIIGENIIHIRLWLQNLRKTDGVGGLGVVTELLLKGSLKI
jgi:hypothetical protein